MDMFEKARAVEGTLKLCNITQSQLAKQMGVSQSYIANKLRLLNYSKENMALILELGLSERHARSILRIENEEERTATIKMVSGMNLSVRECESIVDSSVEKSAPKLIGKADKLNGVIIFNDTLKRSIESLRSLGVEAKSRISYDECKTYITIMIANV